MRRLIVLLCHVFRFAASVDNEGGDNEQLEEDFEKVIIVIIFIEIIVIVIVVINIIVIIFIEIILIFMIII